MSVEISRREALRLGLAASTIPIVGFGRSETPKATIVAGSASDAMIVRHVSLSGSQNSIGRQLAAMGKAHHATIGDVEKQMGAKRSAWFRDNWPQVAQRGTGSGLGMGLDVNDTTKDIYSLSYNVMAEFGCSCSYYPPDRTTTGHAMLSRNYDFSTGTLAHLTGRPSPAGARGFTADPYIIETHPEKGIATLMLVSYDLVAGCIDGINEYGLAAALLADDQANGGGRSRGPQVGLGEIEVPRFFLERCRNVEECVALAKSIPYYFTFIPCHYIVGDPSGRSAVIEWDVAKKKLHVTEGGKKPQVVTNHLLFAHPDSLGRADDGPGGSFTRYKKLRKAIDPRGKMSKAEIIQFHESVMPRGSGAAVSQPVGRTLWHSLYDLEDRSLSISFYLRDDPGAPLGQVRTPYKTFRLRR